MVQELKVEVESAEQASKAQGKLLVQELGGEVEAAEQASKAQGKLLVQKLEPAETTLEVDVKAVEQGSRNLVVVLTAAQAGFRLILQIRTLRQMT